MLRRHNIKQLEGKAKDKRKVEIQSSDLIQLPSKVQNEQLTTITYTYILSASRIYTLDWEIERF